MTQTKSPLALWLEALRSGEFTQTKSVMHSREGGYCCLGVGCEVFKRTTGIGEWVPEDWRASLGFKDDPETTGSVSYLTPTVKQWLGMDSSDPGFFGEVVAEKDYGEVMTASSLNDAGFTFSQIADLIEHFYEG